MKRIIIGLIVMVFLGVTAFGAEPNAQKSKIRNTVYKVIMLDGKAVVPHPATSNGDIDWTGMFKQAEGISVSGMRIFIRPDALNTADKFMGRENSGTQVPSEYQLQQNYPNPFNATTRIDYTLPSEGHVKLEIYNVAGQKIATLLDDFESAGDHSVSWDAGDNPSGIYFYHLTSSDFSQTMRMTLVK